MKRLAAFLKTTTVGGLDEAKAKGWTVVSMKEDWKAIFPPPK